MQKMILRVTPLLLLVSIAYGVIGCGGGDSGGACGQSDDNGPASGPTTCGKGTHEVDRNGQKYCEAN